MRLRDTAALVTGGGSGLGGATAGALAGQGVRVFALDLAKTIESAPAVDGVTYVEADVTDPDQVQAAVDQAAGSGKPLRTAVSCAGISAFMPLLSLGGRHDVDLFRRVIEVNLIGTCNVTVLAAEAISRTEPLADGARGVVINTTSINAFDGMAGTSAYVASKSGVAGLTLPCARDLAPHGIRVMAIAPGLFNTPMLGLVDADDELRALAGANVPFPKRMGRPDEFGQLIIDIIEHDYFNGDVIRLDGGLRLTAGST